MSASKQLRKNLDDFFNPGPSEEIKDTEDNTDIYDHTKEFFRKDLQDNENVEIGIRRIKGDIDDLDDIVYGGKKVTRQQLEQDLDDESDIDLEEESESQEQDQLEEESEIESEKTNIKEARGDQEIQQEDVDELMEGEEDQDLDIALKQLKEEDKDESKFIQQRISSDIEKGKSVKTQKKLYDQFLHQRILMQKMLTISNKMPSLEILKQFMKINDSISTGLLESRRQLKKYIKDTVILQKNLFQISETNVQLQDINEEEKSDQIWKILDQNYNATLPFVEETIDRWNSRTQIIKNINQSHNKHKTFNRTILEQVNQMFQDEGSKHKLIEKTQLKREAYKIFGRLTEDITNERDTEIYNDYDFYQNMLKDFLATNDQQTTGINEMNGDEGDNDDIYLDGANLGITQKFLQKRQKLKEAKAAKRKEIDRRASKNRKIRYVIHEKLVNFMTPSENIDMQEGKDQMLKSLFGNRPNDQFTENQQSHEIKKIATRNKEIKLSYVDKDEIKLI